MTTKEAARRSVSYPLSVVVADNELLSTSDVHSALQSWDRQSYRIETFQSEQAGVVRPSEAELEVLKASAPEDVVLVQRIEIHDRTRPWGDTLIRPVLLAVDHSSAEIRSVVDDDLSVGLVVLRSHFWHGELYPALAAALDGLQPERQPVDTDWQRQMRGKVEQLIGQVGDLTRENEELLRQLEEGQLTIDQLRAQVLNLHAEIRRSGFSQSRVWASINVVAALLNLGTAGLRALDIPEAGPTVVQIENTIELSDEILGQIESQE